MIKWNMIEGAHVAPSRIDSDALFIGVVAITTKLPLM